MSLPDQPANNPTVQDLLDQLGRRFTIENMKDSLEQALSFLADFKHFVGLATFLFGCAGLVGMWRLFVRRPPEQYADLTAPIGWRNRLFRAWAYLLSMLAGSALAFNNLPEAIQLVGFALLLVGGCALLARQVEMSDAEIENGRFQIRKANDTLIPLGLVLAASYLLWLSMQASISADTRWTFGLGLLGLASAAIGLLARRRADVTRFIYFFVGLAAIISMTGYDSSWTRLYVPLKVSGVACLLIVAGIALAVASRLAPLSPAPQTGQGAIGDIHSIPAMALRKALQSDLIYVVASLLVLFGILLLLAPTEVALDRLRDAVSLPLRIFESVWPYMRSPVLFCLTWIAVGVGAYWVRSVYQLNYGVLEVVFGVLGIAAAAYSLGASTKFITVVGSLYVIVRGLDNMERGLKDRRPTAHALWRAVFFWNWPKSPVSGILNIRRIVSEALSSSLDNAV
jgi:hypothetical protein